MRMRKKKNLDVRFAKCAEVMIADPAAHRGNWQAVFGNANPVHLEIGCGKGRFVLESARRMPEVNFVAIEIEEGALIMATEAAAAQAEQTPNVRFISFDAAALPEIFAAGELSRIYLNFSDPWPRNNQRKRRLTWRGFLEGYGTVLQDDGEIIFKTDNQKLFEWSLSEFCQNNWLIQNISLDLHATTMENIMTEYEEKFSNLGFRIYRVEVRKRLPQHLIP